MYVNVIARLRSEESGSQSDGVVSIESATLPWASETIFVRSLHREIPNSAEAILAVAKVLLKRIEPENKTETLESAHVPGSPGLAESTELRKKPTERSPE